MAILKKLSTLAKVGTEMVAQSIEERGRNKNISTPELLEREYRLGAANYRQKMDAPVLTEGENCIVRDREGKEFFDALAAYSSLNQGHKNLRIIVSAIIQMLKLSLTSRAFENDQLYSLYEEIKKILGVEMILPMNTGAEAVETAIKAVLLDDFVKTHQEILGKDRNEWGTIINKKNLQPRPNRNIIVAKGNFHGRTRTVINASSEPAYKNPFGRYNDLFKSVDFGNIEEMEAAIDEGTVAIMIEPIQAEGGIIVPPEGYLKQVRELCDKKGIKLIFDEIQTGLGRTGKMFAADHEGVRPDLACIGKALSGGNYPVSAVVGKKDILGKFYPGSHGSTFAGNPVAAVIAREALRELREKELPQKAAKNGDWFMEKLKEIKSPHVKEIRGKGLLIGIALQDDESANKYCAELQNAKAKWRGREYGILCNDTHGTIIRIAPPLTIEQDQLEAMLPEIARVLGDPDWQRFINPEVQKPLSIIQNLTNTAKGVRSAIRRIGSSIRG